MSIFCGFDRFRFIKQNPAVQGFVFVLGINDKENYVLLNDFEVAVVVGEFIAAFNRFNGDKAFFFALFKLFDSARYLFFQHDSTLYTDYLLKISNFFSK